jgi:hypothetical protein
LRHLTEEAVEEADVEVVVAEDVAVKDVADDNLHQG